MEKVSGQGKIGKDLMKLLGIDFGLKNIGLAMAEGSLAEPVGVIQDENQIKRLSEEYGIEKIIIGISEAEMAKKIRAFGERLKRTTRLPVEYQDETLSSEEAKRLLVKIGKPKKKRQKQIDAISAAIILQSYLDKQLL